jgi:hypothetical protein
MLIPLRNKRQLKKLKKDISILSLFTEIYCRNFHENMDKRPVKARGILKDFSEEISKSLCEDCERLLLHSVTKRVLCPYEPKPACKKCPTPCYFDGFREKMRDVMRFSGAYLIKKGRLDYIFKYFF